MTHAAYSDSKIVPKKNIRAAFVANTSWYLFNFRLPLLRSLRADGWQVTLLAPPDRYSSLLAAEGFRYIPISIARRGLNPVTDLVLLCQLAATYREGRYDVIHHFTIKPILYGSLAARIVRSSAAVVNSVTGLGYVFMGSGFARVVLRRCVTALYRLALGAKMSVSIFQNPDDAREFVRRGLVNERRIRLIRGSGVATDVIVPAPFRDVGPLTVLVQCRMLRDKGIVETVEAVRLANRRGATVRLLLAGDVDEGNPTSLTVAELKTLEGKETRWVGHVDNIASLLAMADVVALASVREGVPRSLLEGGAAGLPLVATDVPGCREVVKHGVNGFLVSLGDVDSMAAAFATLARDRDLRRAMGRAAREIVEAEFSNQQVIAETKAVYGEIVQSKCAV